MWAARRCLKYREQVDRLVTVSGQPDCGALVLSTRSRIVTVKRAVFFKNIADQICGGQRSVCEEELSG